MVDTAVYATMSTVSEEEWNAPRGPYWVSATVGAMIGRDASDALFAKKTTDGGATWNANVNLFTANGGVFFDVWFDQQTPGQTDDKLHVAYADIAAGTGFRLKYANYDISADAWSTPVSINATADTGAKGTTFITKTRNGGFVAGYCDHASASGAFRSNDGTTWSSAANPFESNAADWARGAYCMVGTGDAKDAAIIFQDVSADAWSVKMYDDSADTWTETAGGALVDLITSTPWELSVRISDGHCILVIANSTDTVGDDQECWDLQLDSIASPTLTKKTDVLTNSAETGCAGIFIDQGTNDLYACYSIGTSFGVTATVKYKKSTDGGATWGTETAYSEAAATNYRVVTGGAMGASGSVGRFQPMFFQATANDTLVNLTNDIQIDAPSAGTTSGPLVNAGHLVRGALVYGKLVRA